MNTPKIISTLQCQICQKEGLIPMMPAKGRGRRVVVCENEVISHVKMDGQHFLIHKKLDDLDHSFLLNLN